MNWKEIGKSPRFWAAMLMIVFVIVATYAPAVAAKLDETTIISTVIALVAFIAAETVGCGPSYMAIFGSVKFWALVISLIFIFVRAFVPTFPVSEDLIQGLVLTLGAGSVGTSYRPVGQVSPMIVTMPDPVQSPDPVEPMHPAIPPAGLTS
jgi:uncharacterized membrane protein